MSYNIHPILVHFPIALLFVYSIIKILPVRRFWSKIAWLDIERLLLSLGVVMAFLAALTGSVAESLVKPNHQVVEAHSTFAGLSIFLYGLLLVGEIASFLESKLLVRYPGSLITKLVIIVRKILTHHWLTPVLVLAALIALSITGLLGGVMVYGLSADPFAATVLKLLGISL